MLVIRYVGEVEVWSWAVGASFVAIIAAVIVALLRAGTALIPVTVVVIGFGGLLAALQGIGEDRVRITLTLVGAVAGALVLTWTVDEGAHALRRLARLLWVLGLSALAGSIFVVGFAATDLDRPEGLVKCAAPAAHVFLGTEDRVTRSARETPLAQEQRPDQNSQIEELCNDIRADLAVRGMAGAVLIVVIGLVAFATQGHRRRL